MPIPPILIPKKKKSELASALFRSEVLVLILGPLMSTNIVHVGNMYNFCPIVLENKSRSEQNKYTRFINS